MQCPRCQAQNREAVRFCEECGARLALACPACGAEVAPEKKFCGCCGAPLATQPPERFTSPQAYTPKHLAEKILTSRNALYEWGLMYRARGKAGDREKVRERLGSALEIFQRVLAKKDVEKVLAATETLRA